MSTWSTEPGFSARKPERGPGDDQITDRPSRAWQRFPRSEFLMASRHSVSCARFENELGIKYEIQEAEAFFETFFEMFPQIAAYQPRRLRMLSAWTVFALSAEPVAGFLRSWMIATAITGRHSNGARRSSSTLPFRVREPIS